MHKKDLRLVSKAERVEFRKRAVRAVLEAPDRSINRIAKIMGVRWHTLNTWVELYKAGGEEALGVDNRGAQKWDNTILTEKENKMIYKMITNKTPDQLEMNFMLWTRRAIQE
ncbi:MAG: helix-turn-helix domain-containing protein, partial [Ignavibacteria bacterium]|nr:helix-turn-helix domain-containing protein [Ignavibacteria bacterium]